MSDNRIIMNANLGCTNIMPFDDFNEIVTTTLEHIIDSILPLCGSKALHDLVVYRDRADEYMSNIFSNDGIHILKKIEYLSPIQTYIANYIRYIAERVERAAADGTSTAIYLAANLIIRTFEEIAQIRCHAADGEDVPGKKLVRGIDDIEKTYRIMSRTKALADEVVDVLQFMLTSLEDWRIVLNEASPKLRNTLIRKLAYTTSKGNEVLTDYAVTLFTDIPEILYEYTTYRKSELETNDDFMVENPEHDLIINVSPSNNTIYNSKLGTELDFESCDLLICPQLYDTLNFLMEYLDQRSEYENAKVNLNDASRKPPTPLIVVYNGINDVDLAKLERYANKDVVLCRYLMYHPAFLNNPLELNVAQVISGLDPITQKNVDEFQSSVIHNVRCRIYSKDLFVYRLFDHSTAPLHPFYHQEDRFAYHQLRRSLEERITTLKESHTKNAVVQELSEFVRIYRNLICSRLPVLTIGGSTVNHLSNINVVDDVLGVVSVAMKHGVILDGIPKLHQALKLAYDINRTDWLNGFRRSVADFCQLTYQTKDVWLDLDISNESLHHLRDYISVKGKWVTLDKDNIDKVTVVQSYRAITETLNRLIETIPRLICTDQVIVQNSVMDNKKE